MLSRIVGDDAPMVDDHYPLGLRIGLLEVVGGQHDGGLLLAPDPGDVLPQVGSVLRVHPGGGLVQEQQGRTVHQPQGDVEPSLLAAGQGRHPPGLHGRQVEGPQQLPGLSHRVRGVHPVEAPLTDQLVQHPKAEPRPGALTDIADPGAHPGRLVDDVGTGDHRRPRGWRQQRGEHPQRGRLARAVRPEEGHQLARGDVDVDTADGFHGLFLGLEGLRQLFGMDHFAAPSLILRTLY